jgi:Protein of unknown function (DUF3047)
MAFFFSSCKLCVMTFLNTRWRFFLCLGLSWGLVACSSLEKQSDIAMPAITGEHAIDNVHWQPWALPSKRQTQFKRVKQGGREAIHASAMSSASLMRKKIRIDAVDLGALKFSWQTPMLIEAADMAERDAEDAVVRVILSFEGDRSKFSNKNRMLSDLSQALTGEEMPYATLMYVWCNMCPVGSVIVNPRTDRIRKLVVESGKGNLGKWLDYERDIRADFMQAFGEEPGAITGIALMTDTDNTQSKATAWYGPISFKPPAKTAVASKP